MDTHLEIDKKNNLVEVRSAKERYPLIVRIAAKIISYIFHPLFIPVYLSWFILETQSYLFASASKLEKIIFIARFAVIYTMFPLISVLLMKALGFISSIYLKTQRDRIIPYVVCMIYYWWMWYVLHHQPQYSDEFVILSLAIFLASVGGLMANIKMKISMHAIAAGIMVAFVVVVGLSQDVNFGGYMAISILLTGLICTARLIVSDHTMKEIYWGLFIGILSLLIASKFV
jgi:hypothetical protein